MWAAPHSCSRWGGADVARGGMPKASLAISSEGLCGRGRGVSRSSGAFSDPRRPRARLPVRAGHQARPRAPRPGACPSGAPGCRPPAPRPCSPGRPVVAAVEALHCEREPGKDALSLFSLSASLSAVGHTCGGARPAPVPGAARTGLGAGRASRRTGRGGRGRGGRRRVCGAPRASLSGTASRQAAGKERESETARRATTSPLHSRVLPRFPVPSHTISQPTHNSHSTMRAAATVTRPGAALAPGLSEFVCGWLPRPPPSTSRPATTELTIASTRAPLPVPPTHTARRPTSARRAAALIVRAEDAKVRERRKERQGAALSEKREADFLRLRREGAPLLLLFASLAPPPRRPARARARHAPGRQARLLLAPGAGAAPPTPRSAPERGPAPGEVNTRPPRLSLASAALWV
jgi:hypothetical protein